MKNYSKTKSEFSGISGESFETLYTTTGSDQRSDTRKMMKIIEIFKNFKFCAIHPWVSKHFQIILSCLILYYDH